MTLKHDVYFVFTFSIVFWNCWRIELVFGASLVCKWKAVCIIVTRLETWYQMHWTFLFRWPIVNIQVQGRSYSLKCGQWRRMSVTCFLVLVPQIFAGKSAVHQCMLYLFCCRNPRKIMLLFRRLGIASSHLHPPLLLTRFSSSCISLRFCDIDIIYSICKNEFALAQFAKYCTINIMFSFHWLVLIVSYIML